MSGILPSPRVSTYSHEGGEPRWSRQRFRWSAAALWVAVLLYVVTEERLKLPRWGLITLAAVAVIGLIAASGWWVTPIQGATRWLRQAALGQAQEATREATIRQGEVAVAALTALFCEQDDTRRGRWHDRSRRRHDRTILAEYHRVVRASCLQALAALRAKVPVPPAIAEAADQPRDVRDLYEQLVWLTTAVEQMKGSGERR